MTRAPTPINLNKRRKEKARAEKRARSDTNSVKFGRRKSEKAQDAGQVTRLDRFVDGHKRDE